MKWDRKKAEKAFREEAYELLAELETALLELEETPGDMELVGRIFRALHTLKGTGSMFGFDDIAGLVHEAEAVFDLMRNGELEATGELIDLSLSMRDRILHMLDDGQEGRRSEGGVRDEIFEAFRNILDNAGRSRPGKPAAAEASRDSGGTTVTYRIRFRPSGNIFTTGASPVGLLDELRGLGRCTVIARTEEIPLLDEIDPELCYTHWDIILSTDKGRNEIQDVFIFVEIEGGISIDALHRGAALNSEDGHRKVEEVLGRNGDVSPEDVAGILDELGFSEDAAEIDEAVQSSMTGLSLNGSAVSGELSGIRVPSGKLDKLVDLVGEMVTVQARLSQVTVSRADPDLLLIAEEVERLTEELRDNTMSLRMVPIGTTFSRFRRLVRDLSKELGKEVELTAEGEETELDKKVIEKISDPLVHIIRNAIDHGIEPPAEREAAGKPRLGTVHLSASHTGAHIHIQIKDDGAGFNTAGIRKKAVEKGLVPKHAELSEKDILSLVFMPGFSTSDGVSSVSGRGVGLDVAKMRVEALKGIVEVDSEAGQGTTITLKLPLTLAIIEGLLVKVKGEHFVVPLSTVEECVELVRGDMEDSNGRHMMNVRGEIVPYINLREQFSLEGDLPPIQQVVITRAGHGRVGFVVDTVVGELQTVIKSLGRFYRDIKGVSGATILGDGAVALILDIPRLIKSVEKEEAGRFL
jgi:two-component system chemotaxis sensor kinase CheA